MALVWTGVKLDITSKITGFPSGMGKRRLIPWLPTCLGQWTMGEKHRPTQLRLCFTTRRTDAEPFYDS